MKDIAFVVRAYGCLSDLVFIRLDGKCFESFRSARNYLESLGFTWEEASYYLSSLPTK